MTRLLSLRGENLVKPVKLGNLFQLFFRFSFSCFFPLQLSNVLVFGANILAFIHCFIWGFFKKYFSIGSKINVLGRDMRKSSAVNLNHHIALVQPVQQSSGLKVKVRYDSLPWSRCLLWWRNGHPN